MVVDGYDGGRRCGEAFERVFELLDRNIVVFLGIGFDGLDGSLRPGGQWRYRRGLPRLVAPERRLLPSRDDCSSLVERRGRRLGALVQPLALQYLVDGWSLLRIMQENAF